MLIVSSTERARPNCVTIPVCIHNIKISATCTKRCRHAAQEIPAAWCSDNNLTAVVIASAKGATPNAVAICIRFHQPEVCIACAE
jgi:hypothetical protein